MRIVESSFLRRSLMLVAIAALSVGLGGCLWHDGHNGRAWGWNHGGDRDGNYNGYDQGYNGNNGHHGGHHGHDDDD